LREAGGVADQDRRGQRAAAEFGQQLRAVRLDELEQFCLELLRLAVEAAQLGDLLARDPDPRAGRQLPKLSLDPVQPARLVQRPAL